MMKKVLLSFLLILFSILNSFSQTALDTIALDLNPALFKKDFSSYDRQTAIYCAQLAEVAYWDPSEIEILITKLNTLYPNYNHRFEFVEDKKSGTQLIFFGTNEYMVIAFRGTEFTKEFKDIVLDAKFFRYYQETGYSNLPSGHGGFRRSIINLIDDEHIFDKLRAFQNTCNVKNEPNFPVYTTGHSLGAALATLIIEPLYTEQFHFSGCYNFAPPLVIDKTETPALSAKYNLIVYDIVNYLDYVPRAGKSSRKYLGRIGKFYRICESGFINDEDEKRNGKYVGHRWRTKFKLYKFHKLKGYLDGLKNPNNTNEAIIGRKAKGIRCF